MPLRTVQYLIDAEQAAELFSHSAANLSPVLKTQPTGFPWTIADNTYPLRVVEIEVSGEDEVLNLPFHRKGINMLSPTDPLIDANEADWIPTGEE